jgi:hypothetical protein
MEFCFKTVVDTNFIELTVQVKFCFEFLDCENIPYMHVVVGHPPLEDRAY